MSADLNIKDILEAHRKWRLNETGGSLADAAADLSGANLRGADLRGANLRGADLSRANLRDAVSRIESK